MKISTEFNNCEIHNPALKASREHTQEVCMGQQMTPLQVGIERIHFDFGSVK